MATKLSEVGQAMVDAHHAYVTWKDAETEEGKGLVGHGAVMGLRAVSDTAFALVLTRVAGYDADPAPE